MRTYSELTLEERVEIQQRLESGDTLRAIGRSLGRAASTISRECRRIDSESARYKAHMDMMGEVADAEWKKFFS